ncbi:hypothetical protein Ddc_15150 [Ditylenchus destructor]|nr:hypothetical protein Ddc_15150 [Ditylenchus destructor]
MVTATMKKHVGVQGVLGCLTAPSHEIKATIELGYKVGTTPTILGTLNVDNVNYCSLPTLKSEKDESGKDSATRAAYTNFSFKQSFNAASQSQIIIQDMAYGSFKIEGQWAATVEGQPFVKISHHCPFGKDEVIVMLLNLKLFSIRKLFLKVSCSQF